MLQKKGEELGWVIDGKLAVDPYPAIALNLLAGKGYIDDSSRVNLERLPLYTYFLVLIYKFWGSELWKLQVVQSTMDTISCLLLYFISLRTFQDRASALLAAFLYAVYFKVIALVARPFSEPLYIVLLLIFLYLFIRSFDRTAFALGAGVMLGMMTLTKPITLMFPLVTGALYIFRLKRLFVSRLLLFTAGFVFLVMPLVIRNYCLTGRVFLATGGKKMLYMGTVLNCRQNFRGEEGRLVKEINRDYAFPYNIGDDDLLGRLAVEKIVSDPGAYLQRMACRLYLFWAYPDYSTKRMAAKTVLILLFNVALILLTAGGLRIAGKRRIVYSPFLAIIIYYYGMYVLSYANSRYSLPLYPILFMFSSYGFLAVFRKKMAAHYKRNKEFLHRQKHRGHWNY
ncbi:MAG: glycosyltransferase family 39 protein [PVC group bacterium]